jgi:hypothetical protein
MMNLIILENLEMMNLKIVIKILKTLKILPMIIKKEFFQEILMI